MNPVDIVVFLIAVAGFLLGIRALILTSAPYKPPFDPPARPAPPMPKVKPARTEVQVLPANVDRLILSYPEFLSKEQRESMAHLLKAQWEDDTRKVIVLEGGIKIEAVMLKQGEIYKDEDMDIPRSHVEPTKPWRESKPDSDDDW